MREETSGHRLRGMRRPIGAVVLAVSASVTACAAQTPPAPGHTITYDAATRTVHVCGASEDEPAVPADIAAADAANGWAVATVEPTGATTKVAANLTVGRSDGSSTWFHIGGSRNPNETLVVQGRLAVAGSRVVSWNRYEGSNALVLGGPDPFPGRPVLRLEVGAADRGGLVFGPGCTLLAWDARIGALTPERERWATWSGSPQHLRLLRCTLSGFGQLTAFQTSGQTSDTIVEGCVFEHMDTVFGNGRQYLENCTFRNVGCALADGGALCATAVGCRFENNGTNWRLGATFEGIRAIDCAFGPTKSPGPHIRSHLWPKTRVRSYPLFIAERHIVVRVRDEAGRAVPGARVAATCEQASSPTGTLIAVTGPDGRTPAADSGRALRLTDFVHQATDTADNPRTTSLTYTLRVEARGCGLLELGGIDPDVSWQEKTVVLRPEK